MENISSQLAELRLNYSQRSFDMADAASEPFTQFEQWIQEAIGAELREPNAMHLATVGADGKPVGRVVLLKGLDERGFIFYTNYESRKGQDLAHKPYAALTFFWAELERQVRIEGSVEKVSEAEATAYFQSRPLASQIGAWASPQSRELPNRAALEAAFEQYAQAYQGASALPKPPHWGGYRVVPEYVEFWQGRRSRLHDRLAYRLVEGGWQLVRLAP